MVRFNWLMSYSGYKGNLFVLETEVSWLLTNYLRFFLSDFTNLFAAYVTFTRIFMYAQYFYMFVVYIYEALAISSWTINISSLLKSDPSIFPTNFPM